jgi:hypothetical protein
MVPPNGNLATAWGFSTSTNAWANGDARTDPNATNIQNGLLFSYNTSTAIDHCPADRSKVEKPPKMLRTRSYSLAAWL